MTNRNHKEVELQRLVTRITGPAMTLLKDECARRARTEARQVPYGTVVSECLETVLRASIRQGKQRSAA